jgi:hypothetical protein
MTLELLLPDSRIKRANFSQNLCAMSINYQLKQNRLPQFNFKLPLPPTPIDYLEFSYEMDKKGEALILTINIDYRLEDFDTKEKYEVTRFRSVYEVVPEDEPLTAKKLYPICQTAADTLNSCLDFLVQCNEVPPKTVGCPPVCHLHAGLQEVVDWYNSH